MINIEDVFFKKKKNPKGSLHEHQITFNDYYNVLLEYFTRKTKTSDWDQRSLGKHLRQLPTAIFCAKAFARRRLHVSAHDRSSRDFEA